MAEATSQDPEPAFPTGWRPFGESWTVTPDGGSPTAVELPHDAMISERRTKDAPSSYHGAYFPGGRYTYRKSWIPPRLAPTERLVLRFEGVPRISTVSVNGAELGGEHGAYREFEVDVTDALKDGANDIAVVADNRDHPNSRWYVGSGIHRPVSARIRGAVSLHSSATRIDTTVDARAARIDVGLEFSNPDGLLVQAAIAIEDRGRQVAHATTSTSGTALTLSIPVPDARLWSADDPHLYDGVVTLTVDGVVVDGERHRIGIRTIVLDRSRGLLVNGEPVLLRGGNVHHDNGVIGSVALPAAERRRARILKENGFNAIRSAHNPLSRAMLDACDEVGLYVMDEITDVWWNAKTDYDDSATFMERWRTDLADLVRRDRVHPSVIMYSISNENNETASVAGVKLARQMKAVVRSIDDTRFVSAGVNITLNALGRGDAEPPHPEAAEDASPAPEKKAVSSTLFNIGLQFAGPIMKVVTKTKRADRATRAVFDVLDVAGYNYGSGRYASDVDAYPDRYILGTEDMPGDLPAIWAMAETMPAVLGDFLWAGWDYLGEAGVGHWTYGRRLAPLMKPFPYLTSGSGVIDITGNPTAGAHLARAVWQPDRGPVIAVRPLDVSGKPVTRSAWRSSDAVSSWAWSGQDGRTAEVEVYSSGNSVQLSVNGSVVGTRPAGAGAGFVARFRVPYRPGEIVAVEQRPDGTSATTRLRSARGDLTIRLTPDREVIRSDGGDLAHISIDIVDGDGIVESLADDDVALSWDGPASLAGFGSAAPFTEESFADQVHRTYYGHALAVVRAGRQPGEVTVRATSRRHGSATCVVTIA